MGNFIGPEPTISVIGLKRIRFLAIRSGIMQATGELDLPERQQHLS